MTEWQKTDDEMKDSHSVWDGRGLSSLSVNPIKWSETFQKTRQQQPTNWLSVFDHFVGLTL